MTLNCLKSKEFIDQVEHARGRGDFGKFLKGFAKSARLIVLVLNECNLS